MAKVIKFLAMAVGGFLGNRNIKLFHVMRMSLAVYLVSLTV